MAEWMLLHKRWINDTSPEYGYGDYEHAEWDDTGDRCEADDERQAEAAFRRVLHARGLRARFSSRVAAWRVAKVPVRR